MSTDILDYTNGPVIKTGQTTAYPVAGRTAKDDGTLQLGIEASKEDAQYVVLTTGQYAGTTNVTVNGKVDAHTNNCVYDKVTGLLWSRDPSPLIYGVSGLGGLLWDDSAGAGEDIFAYCDAANAAALASYTDWRVPNFDELNSLIVREGALHRGNSTAFPTWPTGFSVIPSSTTQATNINYIGYAQTGLSVGQPKTTSTFNQVYIVRAGLNR